MRSPIVSATACGLLQHEGLVAVLLGGFVVPVDLELLALPRPVLDGIEARAVFGDRDHLAVLDQLDARGLREERRDGGGQEHFPVSNPDDERALQARSDQHLGVVSVDDDEGEVPLELGVRLAHSIDEVAVVMALDEMRDDLGVGLGREGVPVVEQRLPQLPEVLDDPVQDDRDLVVDAAGQRVRVLVGDLPVSRPASVADSRGRIGAVEPGLGLQLIEVTDGPNVLQPAVLEQRETRRVVPAVFEPLQPLKEESLRGPRAHVSDDPAHVSSLFD